MGESSAKMLRGDNMADVIFNGSSVRKPVGKASVELIFDNSDGRAPGNYGQFAEISVKRTLTRDGQSTYQINNIKTRRRDVLDLFRGTGLGPRSYSIIEQGMVSRIVEARPEDLRVFVEEAAGTSKYKDRRRESELRIQRTRDNLDRVADIRDELAKQLRRLKRQSASARRFKVLKEEERAVAGQLHVLRLNALIQQLSEQDRSTAEKENTLQAALAGQRESESGLESLRKQQSEVQEANSEIQQEFYRVGADISNLEQKIENQRQSDIRQEQEIEQLHHERIERQEQIELDTGKVSSLSDKLAKIQPQLDGLEKQAGEAGMRLADSEKVLQDWLSEVENFNELSRKPAQQVEVQKSRIDYLLNDLERTEVQKEALDQQLSALTMQLQESDVAGLREEVHKHDLEYDQAESEFQQMENRLKGIHSDIEGKRDRAAGYRNQLHETTSRMDSLREIQQAALGGDNQSLENWLDSFGLDGSCRLASELSVEPGWERAVDRILNGFLTAIRVGEVGHQALQERPDFSFTLLSASQSAPCKLDSGHPGLIEKIRSGADMVGSLLSGIYISESLETAMEVRGGLQGRDVLVTPDGTVVGNNWISFVSQGQQETGVLVREDEINQLQEKSGEIATRITLVEEQLTQLDQGKHVLQEKLEDKRSALAEKRSAISMLHNKFGREEAHFQEVSSQFDQLRAQLDEAASQVNTDRSEIENARTLLATATEQSGDLERQKEKLIERKEELNAQVSTKRNELNEATESSHRAALRKQAIEAELASTMENVNRLKLDLEQSGLRLDSLGSRETEPGESIDSKQSQLQALIDSKVSIDARFSSCRDDLSVYDKKITELEDDRKNLAVQVNERREELDRQRLAKQEIMVRRDTHLESVKEQGFDMEECGSGLPQDARLERWQEMLEEIERKVARIGPVNLVAIEEFDEESERMEYLDRQHTDLTEALDTLESVIRKIDRETRTRFRETFDKINQGFNEYFPKLFGGGRAELQLTSDDLLTAGVSVMARPPGKRNTHIHLLSGGEKALTAVALLFSLFELHPAPFCMLDEVDAPLDDANVDRYCDTLKRLAAKSQMIVITHNKITMEAMDLLVGVTMEEAGVSRIVSVDVGQAVKMASQ
jgi:chromosome segregation protein